MPDEASERRARSTLNRIASGAARIWWAAWFLVMTGVFAATVTHWREIPPDVLREMVRSGAFLACWMGALLLFFAARDRRRARRVDVPDGTDRFDPVQLRRFALTLPMDEARRVCADALAAPARSALRPVVVSDDTIVARSTRFWRGHLPVLRVELVSLDETTTHVRLSGSVPEAPLTFERERTLRAVEEARRAILEGADRTRARERAAVPGWSVTDGDGVIAR